MKINGFTLIELVVVIIVLAILSVIAAPRFIELQSDVRISSLKGLQAEMHGAMSVLYPKSVLQGLQNKPPQDKDDATDDENVIIIDGQKIHLAYGYPAADSKKAWSMLIMATFTDSVFNDDEPGDWYFHNDGGDNFIRFMTQSKKYSGDNCYLKYTQATSPTTPPVFEIVDSGC
ncbi:prepilin-type N-terminal cleavage/methylation domain-containing protein [Shewanella sp. Isolate13]|uniref:type II secretion system protein n=1 Tax=Shewanella sp. Isolate13 TaxID=2908531 RepID=UPI001EFE0150|nr:prepilin-type N-terminal cleavage/methylation domain-containing protein [Shewanella sp. Isolate13]MCG9731089.1 prepilin-type N-terminal cleavage/methylation domain-containing protein [Shewanella sp. Isolate13]